MPRLRPYRELFYCAKLKARVAIVGMDVEQDAEGGGVKLTSGKRSCSGCPRCGTMLGVGDCPYPVRQRGARD